MYGMAYIGIGITHFTSPDIFIDLVPEIIGMPFFWVYLSGVFEVGIGIGICLPRFRRYATLALIPLLLVLYTANLNMWLNDIPFNGHAMTTGEHIFRAFVQTALVMIALWLGKKTTKK